MIPTDAMHNRPWQQQAACRDADPELFETAAAVTHVPPEAADHCAVCPVAALCYDLAMRAEGGTSPQWRYGIFAGTSPDQRAAAWPKWAEAHGISPNAYRTDLAPCGTAAAYRRHLRNGEPVDSLCTAWNQQQHRQKETRPVGPPVCGTRRGYQRHRRDGEQACQACRDANNAADRRLAATGSTLGADTFPAKTRAAKRLPIAHGTYRGARQHENRREQMCDDCREAYNTERRVQKARRRARRAAERVAA